MQDKFTEFCNDDTWRVGYDKLILKDMYARAYSAYTQSLRPGHCASKEAWEYSKVMIQRFNGLVEYMYRVYCWDDTDIERIVGDCSFIKEALNGHVHNDAVTEEMERQC